MRETIRELKVEYKIDSDHQSVIKGKEREKRSRRNGVSRKL